MLQVVTLALATTTCEEVKSVYSMADCCTDPNLNIPDYDLVTDAKATVLVTSYRTGPYAANGIPFVDGLQAYTKYHNEHDGGVKLHVQECETGYSTQKSLSCLAKYHTATAGIVLSTGASNAAANSTSKLPLFLSGYGYGGPDNDVVHFSSPTYKDAIASFINHHPTAKKFGYLHMPIKYGLGEVPIFESLAKEKNVEVHSFSMGFPAAWGYGVTNHTDILKGATDIDEFFMMPWGGFGEEWLDAALKLGIPMSKFTTIWWGSREVIKPEFENVKVATFVDPNHAPVSLNNVPIEKRVLMSHGMRDGMVFAKIVEHAKTHAQTVKSDSDTYTYDEIVTQENVQQALASKTVIVGDDTFTPKCAVGAPCSTVYILQYSFTTDKFIKL